MTPDEHIRILRNQLGAARDVLQEVMDKGPVVPIQVLWRVDKVLRMLEK